MKFFKKRVFSINIKELIYLHLWHKNKNYFFITKFILITIFTLITLYVLVFFYKILITLLVLKTPSWKDGLFRWKDRWLLPLFSSFNLLIYDLPHDCSDRSGEEGGLRATEVQDSISTTIYISGLTFVKLANDLNLSCLSPTFVTKKVFPMEQNT